LLDVAGERQEVYVAAGQPEASRHRGRIHEPQAHVRNLQPGGQERLQGLVRMPFKTTQSLYYKTFYGRY